jgi:putative flippase GtrA
MLKKILQIKFAHYTTLLKQYLYRIAAILLSERARPLRFVFTGGLCGLIQLVLFTLLERTGLSTAPLPLVANSVAFLLSAQVNFLLSVKLTWGDRKIQQPQRRSGLLARWLTFHGSILGTALLNQLVFLLAHLFLPSLVAVVLGIGVAALANFVLLDRQVFRKGALSSTDRQKSSTEQELENKKSCEK